ncbi:MAG: histidine phosphatase family protein [Pseudomonadota bacterium]|nr:histidine phosphatase family protein [Pseudomonadota bacterium]
MIYLCRHSETEWNREGRLQGHKNSDLTERGRAQAQRMGQAFHREIVDIDSFTLIASPLTRTRQTAEIVCDAIGRDHDQIRFDDRLKEISWGDWEGYTRPEIEDRWPGIYDRRRVNKWEFQPPNGESYALLSHRVGAWLAEISEDQNLIVVSHGAAGRVIRGVYGNMAPGVAIGLTEPQDAFFLLSKGAIQEIPVSL